MGLATIPSNKMIYFTPTYCRILDPWVWSFPVRAWLGYHKKHRAFYLRRRIFDFGKSHSGGTYQSVALLTLCIRGTLLVLVYSIFSFPIYSWLQHILLSSVQCPLNILSLLMSFLKVLFLQVGLHIEDFSLCFPILGWAVLEKYLQPLSIYIWATVSESLFPIPNPWKSGKMTVREALQAFLIMPGIAKTATKPTSWSPQKAA